MKPAPQGALEAASACVTSIMLSLAAGSGPGRQDEAAAHHLTACQGPSIQMRRGCEVHGGVLHNPRPPKLVQEVASAAVIAMWALEVSGRRWRGRCKVRNRAGCALELVRSPEEPALAPHVALRDGHVTPKHSGFLTGTCFPPARPVDTLEFPALQGDQHRTQLRNSSVTLHMFGRVRPRRPIECRLNAVMLPDKSARTADPSA